MNNICGAQYNEVVSCIRSETGENSELVTNREDNVISIFLYSFKSFGLTKVKVQSILQKRECGKTGSNFFSAFFADPAKTSTNSNYLTLENIEKHPATKEIIADISALPATKSLKPQNALGFRYLDYSNNADKF